MSSARSTGAGTPAEPAPGTSPQAGTNQSGTPAEPGATSPNDEPLTLAEAKQLRAEHRSLRERIKAYEDKEAEAEKAKLSETERLQQEAAKHQTDRATLETQLQEARVGRALDREASKMNFVDLDAVAKLIDWTEIDYSETGEPKNITKVLEKLAKDRPYLLSGNPGASPTNTNGAATKPSTGGGPTNPRSNPSNSTGDEPMSQAVYQRLMTDPAEYQRRRAEVLEWRARQR